MTGALLLIAVVLIAYLGFALLAISQTRHWRAVSETVEPGRVGKLALRVAGGVWLFLALCLALFRDGPSFGALLWSTAISLAAAAVAFTLTWCPALLRPLTAMATVGVRLRCDRMKADGQRTANVPPRNPTRP